MASEAKGLMFVPVWVSNGDILPIVDDNGNIAITIGAAGATINVNLETSDITLPTEEQTPLTTLDVTLAASDITLGVTESSPLSSIAAQAQGYLGAAWQKQPLIWGYSDRWYQSVTHTMTEDASYSLSTTAVPEGYIYKCKLMVTVNSGTAVTHSHEIYADGAGVVIIQYSGVAANTWTPTYPMDLVLKEGDQMGASFVNCKTNDVLYLKVWGEIMKIDD